MTELSLDIETFSSNDLKKGGVYKYVQATDFTILLISYSFDNSPVVLIDLAQGDAIPDKVIDALSDPSVLKTAFNANFERTCFARYLGIEMPPEQWECTMVKATMLGLPGSLANVSSVLGLPEQKDDKGKKLIKFFCVPCAPTATNKGRTRNLPEHSLEKWYAFRSYCVQDVIVEQSIRSKINFFTIPEIEKQVWYLDQRINDRGVLLDTKFVQRAVTMDETYRAKLTEEAVSLTSLENPNSTEQLKDWLEKAGEGKIPNLQKGTVPQILKNTKSETVARVLVLRQEMSKTSVSKYVAMANAWCDDYRARGLLQYYGAGRTGRWAGRLIQVQNLPQNHLSPKELKVARELVKVGDLDMMELLFGNVPDILSQLIRTAFIPSPGCRLMVADFSAIEARVIAWLAGEQWRLDVFNTHGKIYEASASQMFSVPIESIVKGSPLRQKGKVAELALGYQGGTRALISMGALTMGLNEDELQPIVTLWREANPAIVNLWSELDRAVRAAILTGRAVIYPGLRIYTKKKMLMIQLPSGRTLTYCKATIGKGNFGYNVIKYQGMNQTTRKWCDMETYGGKICENVVQAIARDILADSMLRLEKAGYPIAMHVHDENVMDVPKSFGSIEEVNRIMGTPIPWAPGLPLAAASFETDYYMKD